MNSNQPQNPNEKNQQNETRNSAPQKNAQAAQGAGFFHLTRHQLSVDISKYENAIADDNTTFKSRLTDSQGNPIVFKKRLNSLDSSMLEEAAYNVLDDTELKLEKKIQTIKKDLAEINEKIEVARTIKDSAAVEELFNQKRELEKKLEFLELEKKTQATEVKLTSVVFGLLDLPRRLKITFLKNFKSFLRNSALLKHIKPLMRSFMVRDTIYKLNKINKSVDELVKMQVPFGEQEARYATLVNHLSRAGALHSQILKEFEG